MKIEYEVRILNIDTDEWIKKVEEMGAIKKGVFHQKRYVYDFQPAQKGRWIRLRSNGKESTLTIKEIKSLRVDGTKELEIVVSNFDDTNEILQKLGYKPRTYQENFRIEYTLNGVNFDFDKWPRIPEYLEIEGTSEQSVTEMIDKMGVNNLEVTTLDVDQVYQKKYGIILDEIAELRFSCSEKERIKELANR